MNLYRVTILFTDGTLDDSVIASPLQLSEVTKRAERSGFSFASITVESL